VLAGALGFKRLFSVRRVSSSLKTTPHKLGRYPVG
jgi:hypothetical protein